jgi:hypothetical protein
MGEFRANTGVIRDSQVYSAASAAALFLAIGVMTWIMTGWIALQVAQHARF